MSDVALEYPYKAKAGVMLACIAFSGVCGATMTHAALTNDRGLILNGIFRFGTQGATVVYWCVVAVTVLFVIVGVLGLLSGLKNPGSIRLTATELSAPKSGFSRRPTTIPLREIVDVGVQTIQKQRFLTVHHQSGKLNVAQSMLPNSEAFEKLHAALVAGVNRIHAPPRVGKAAA
jgi:hypothetical protein